MANAVDERLARMEQSLARWRLLSVLATGLAVASLVTELTGHSSSEIRAHAFSLVGRDGVEMARLSENNQRGPLLELHVPRNGRSVLVGSLGEDLAGVAVSGPDGVLVHLSANRAGAPSLGLRQKAQKVIVGLVADNPPLLQMSDGSAILAATPNELRVKDASGRIVFSTSPESWGAGEAPRRGR